MYGSFRFRNTVLRTCLSVGLVFATLMATQGERWLPSGDAARDSVSKPRADLMIIYGAALIMRHSPGDLYDQRKEGAAQKASTGLDISSEDLDFLPYAYPAIVALSFAPLTVFSYRTA